MRKAGLVMIGAALCLSACGEPRLRDMRSGGEGPDEFLILPSLPLSQPENLTELPAPTPGGINRTDQDPIGDAVLALGGRPGSPDAAVPARDSGLVAYVQRTGVDPDIRARLAEEDADFRRRRGRLTQIRLFPEDRYDQVYQREALDPFETAERYRRAGVPVPSAPPERGR